MPLRNHAFQYVECDIPHDQTLRAWRTERTAEARERRRLVRVLRRPGRRTRT